MNMLSGGRKLMLHNRWCGTTTATNQLHSTVTDIVFISYGQPRPLTSLWNTHQVHNSKQAVCGGKSGGFSPPTIFFHCLRAAPFPVTTLTHHMKCSAEVIPYNHFPLGYIINKSHKWPGHGGKEGRCPHSGCLNSHRAHKHKTINCLPGQAAVRRDR